MVHHCLEEFGRVLNREFPHVVKKILLWFLFAFVAYTVIRAPATAAQTVQEAFGGLSSAGQSVGDFFDAIISSS